MVPALTVLIPGPYKEAVDAAVKYVSRNEKKKKLVIYNMGHNVMQIPGMKRFLVRLAQITNGKFRKTVTGTLTLKQLPINFVTASEFISMYVKFHVM